MADQDRKKTEIWREKQVEATPENQISELEFEPGATFLEEENKKVENVIQAEMEVES